MSIDYVYSRVYVADKWNINNPNDVDANGKPVTLCVRIANDATVGAYYTGIALTSTQAIVTMSQTLTSEEKTALDTVVSTHEAASGTINEDNEIIMTSPDGTVYSATITDLGAWDITAV